MAKRSAKDLSDELDIANARIEMLVEQLSAAQGRRRRRLGDTRESVTRKFRISRPGHRNGDLKMYVTVGLYPDGTPGELFIKADRTGSMASGALDAVALSLSMAWQHGLPFDESVRKLVGTRFEPQGATGDTSYPIVTSPLDYVARWLLDKWGVRDAG